MEKVRSACAALNSEGSGRCRAAESSSKVRCFRISQRDHTPSRQPSTTILGLSSLHQRGTSLWLPHNAAAALIPPRALPNFPRMPTTKLNPGVIQTRSRQADTVARRMRAATMSHHPRVTAHPQPRPRSPGLRYRLQATAFPWGRQGPPSLVSRGRARPRSRMPTGKRPCSSALRSCRIPYTRARSRRSTNSRATCRTVARRLFIRDDTTSCPSCLRSWSSYRPRTDACPRGDGL